MARRRIENDLADVRQEVTDRWNDGGYDDPHFTDTCHEIADNNVPIYHADLLEAAAEDYDLATDTPECGPAFDGEPTPVNIIAANYYERLINEAHETARLLEDAEDDQRGEYDSYTAAVDAANEANEDNPDWDIIDAADYDTWRNDLDEDGDDGREHYDEDLQAA